MTDTAQAGGLRDRKAKRREESETSDKCESLDVWPALGQYQEGVTITNDVWYHFAAVFDGTKSFRNYYVDGVVQKQVTGTPYFARYCTPSHLMVGAIQNSATNDPITDFFPGLLYDVRIYNTPLTSNDIQTIMDPFATPQAKILSFGLPGSPAVINQATTNIAWTVPYGSDVTSLAPMYDLSFEATCDKVSGSTQNFSTPQAYRVISSDNAHTNTYIVTVTLAPQSTAKDMLSFGPGAVIAGHDIRWLVPYGSDVTTLSPTYVMSPLATGYPASGTTNDFSSPRTYTVVAQDLSSNIYNVTAVIATPGWTNGSWTSDADSGITTAYAYLMAVNFGGAATNVNGIAFHASAPSGSNFVIGGGIVTYNGDANNVASALASDFIWGGNPRTVTLSSLTPGMSYKTTFFSVGWEAAGRTQTFNAGGGDVMVLDQDLYGDNNGMAISCQFEADASGSKTFTITPVGAGTFHLYALATAYLGSVQGADMLSFGPGAVIAGTNIAWTVPYGTDVTTLAPVFILSEGATCDKSSGAVTDFTSPVKYTVVSADSVYTNVYTVTVTVSAASTNKDILTFGIPDNPGVISGTYIHLSVPYGAVIAALAPTYTVSQFATGNPPSGTVMDFTTPQTYTVTAQNLSSKAYTVYVTVRPPVYWPITNGLAVWLKADAIDTNDANQVRIVDTNIYLTQWPDQSGNALHAGQGTDTNQPYYLPGDLNGYPTVQWDGTAKFMAGPSNTTIKTVFFVCNVANNGTGYEGMFQSTANQYLIMGDWNSWYLDDASWSTNATRINGVPTYYHGEVWHILRMVSPSTPSFIYQLGRINNGWYYNGRIAEFIAFNRAMSHDEAAAVEQYLSRKYWGGVYITNAPFTVTAGADIVLAGTNSGAIVGDMWISNAADNTVVSFAAPVPATEGWVSPGVASVAGGNYVWVCGTNSEGHVASDILVITGVPEPAAAAAVVVGCWLLLVRRRD